MTDAFTLEYNTKSFNEVSLEQHDNALNLWRRKDFPAYVVKKVDDNTIEIFHEVVFKVERWTREAANDPANAPKSYRTTALEYFREHPKPIWYEAEPHDVWVVKFKDQHEEVVCVLLRNDYFQPLDSEKHLPYRVSKKSQSIQRAYKIWPQDKEYYE